MFYFEVSGSNPIKSMEWSSFLDTTCAGCLLATELDGRSLPAFHFSAFADLNGDCRADLILHSVDKQKKNFLEFYIYGGNSKFRLIKVVPIGDDFQTGQVLDINEDGLNDLVLFFSAKKELVTVFNTLEPANKETNLHCLKNADFGFGFPGLEQTANSKNRIS